VGLVPPVCRGRLMASIAFRNQDEPWVVARWAALPATGSPRRPGCCAQGATWCSRPTGPAHDVPACSALVATPTRRAQRLGEPHP
jgi:hypothetical protein